MTITHVRQLDQHGCGVACLAMITGHAYEAVRAWFRCKAWQNAQARHDVPEQSFRDRWEAHDFGVRGMTDYDLGAYLAEHGFAYALRYANLWQHGIEHRRAPWPPAPFAPVHIVTVYQPTGGHYVVWLPDGRVLDPAGGETTIGALHDVQAIIGVCHMADHLEPTRPAG